MSSFLVEQICETGRGCWELKKVYKKQIVTFPTLWRILQTIAEILWTSLLKTNQYKSGEKIQR